MTCKDCPHFYVCKMYGALQTQRLIHSKWKNCPFRHDKSRIIKLPMEATDELKEELTKYCYERCVDEL